MHQTTRWICTVAEKEPILAFMPVYDMCTTDGNTLAILIAAWNYRTCSRNDDYAKAALRSR